MGFTVEFAVFAIAQNSVFCGIFLLHSASTLSRLCPGTQMPGGSRGAGMGREDGPRLCRNLLNSGVFSLEISGRVSCPRVEADPISSSAEVQAECGCSFAVSLIQQTREKSKTTFYENTKQPCCLFPKHP